MAGEILVVIFVVVMLIFLMSGGDGGGTDQPLQDDGDGGDDGGVGLDLGTETTDSGVVDGEGFDTDTSTIKDYSPEDR